MKASKTEINGETRIKVDLPYNNTIAGKMATITGASWSKALGGWHIPYKKESFQKLRSIFPEIEYPGKNRLSAENTNTGKAINIPGDQEKNVIVTAIGRSILIKLPKNNLDIHFIRSLKYSRWDQKHFHWVIPNYPGNLNLIKDYFKERIRELTVHNEYQVNTSSESIMNIKTNQLLMIKTNNGRIKLIFTFNHALANFIRKFPLSKWDAKNKWWSVPFAERFVEDIRREVKAMNWEVVCKDDPDASGSKVKRITPFEVINYRKCPEEYSLKLKELRYSENTIRTYMNLFEEFINYYSTFEVSKIDEKMIIAFLRYLVMERKVSESYQNQSINAIKFYYERVLGGQRKVYMIERPRHEKKLPTVLSVEEVSRAIQSVKNIKHKAIVMVIYSGGLRISEVINLKIKDIDTKRMQIFVRNAKGKKDRYTLLSKKVIPVLRDYYKEYKPKDWLFEGPAGQQYSESSIGIIVKKAFRDAGIRKQASTHTLRHCFATHLLENGTDIRYIQTLLGHESSKTTEVYTHVTTKGFEQIINPLDNLDV